MFDLYVVILLLMLAIGIALMMYSSQTCVTIPMAIGGALIRDAAHYENNLIVADNAKIVIDGHNLIHDLMHFGNKKFGESLELLCQVLNEMPNKDIHLVIKNPSDKIIKQLDMPLDSVNYIKYVKKLSSTYSNLTFHIAYKKEKTELNQHHEKGRDDFLAIYLSDNGYLVSKDKFRDFSKFSGIKKFKHYAIKNGKTLVQENIEPVVFIDNYNIKKPTLGTHLYYKFVSKKENSLLNGKIVVDKDNTNSMFYLTL